MGFMLLFRLTRCLRSPSLFCDDGRVTPIKPPPSCFTWPLSTVASPPQRDFSAISLFSAIEQWVYPESERCFDKAH